MRQKIKKQAKLLAAVNLAAGAGGITGLWLLHFLLKGNKAEAVILCVYLLSLWWIWRKCTRLFEKPFDSLLDEADEAFQNKYKAENMRTKAEMHALQSQINPHFLYNTLRSIRWMADVQGADNVTGAIDDLIQLFRLTTQIQGEYITIEEDLHIIRLYCEILMIRYMDCFTVEYEVDETLLSCKTIKFLLQPLLENAVVHGLEPAGGGCLILEVVSHGANLDVSVINDGSPLTDEDFSRIDSLLTNPVDPSDPRSHHLGIRNVNERLTLIYGDRSGLHFRLDDQGRTHCYFRIPPPPPGKEQENHG